MLTATQASKQVRNQGVGASECAAILGIDPRRSAYDLWLMKTGKLEEGADDVVSEQAEIGNLIEPTVAAIFESRMGIRLVKPTGTYKAANRIMFANLDRQVAKAERGNEPCELKSSGIIEGWGEEGTDMVPDMVAVQVTAQMLCSGSTAAWVARLAARFGLSFFSYRLLLNNDLAAIVEDRVCSFWDNYVVKDIPPPDSDPSYELVSRAIRQTGKSVPVDAGLVTAFNDLREKRLELERAEEAAKARLVAAMGDAEVGTCPGLVVSFKQITTRKLDGAALKEAMPEIHDKFVRPNTYRKLTTKKEK